MSGSFKAPERLLMASIDYCDGSPTPPGLLDNAFQETDGALPGSRMAGRGQALEGDGQDEGWPHLQLGRRTQGSVARDRRVES